MTPSSTRLLLLLFFAAVILNVTNYLFCTQYYLSKPSHKFTKLGRQLKIPRRISTHKMLAKSKVAAASKEKLNSISNQTFVYRYRDKLCPELPADLGPIISDKTMFKSMIKFEYLYATVGIGGAFKPFDCIARQSVAIIVPIRGYSANSYLGAFLHYMHPILIKQDLDYQIFVIVQSNCEESYFNRGKLLNTAFVEVQRQRSNGWNCIIIHEPYLVPVDTRNLYRCSLKPKQLAVEIEKTDETSYYPEFGEVIALRPEHILKVNGFSNKYWGSGDDYNNLFERLISANYSIERSSRDDGKFITLNAYDGPNIVTKTNHAASLYKKSEDCLSSLSYQLEYLVLKPLFTSINVSISNTSRKKNIQSVRITNKTATKTSSATT